MHGLVLSSGLQSQNNRDPMLPLSDLAHFPETKRQLPSKIPGMQRVNISDDKLFRR